jgi:hypothetical protein
MLKTFATRDEIPEGQREAAVETKDGKFAVSIEEDTTPLKNSVAAARKERDEANRKAKELEARIGTLEESIEAGKAGITGDKLTEIQRKAEERFKPQLAELEKAKGELRKLRLETPAKGLLGKNKAIDQDAAWKIVGEDFDLTDDGKLIVKADPTADVEKYISGTLVTKYPYLFQGSQADGGGASGAQKGAPSGSAKPPTQWTTDERASYIDEHGVEKYQELLNQHLREASKPKQKTA